MRAFPTCDFVVFDSKVIYNSVPAQSGARNYQVRNVSSSKGFISLYEYNIDRPWVDTGRTVQTASIADTGRIYPWISKDSARSSFKTANSFQSSDSTTYNNEFQYGDVLTNVYPLKASISREYITTPSSSGGTYNKHFVALKNRLNFYSLRSEHYKVNSSYGNKNIQTLNMVSIPSIFYGSRIYPGSMSLKWYYTGSLAAELQDSKQNGELIQVGPPGSVGSGSVAGVVMYDEGIIILTGSWALNGESLTLRTAGGNDSPKWVYFGAGMNDGVTQATANSNMINASFGMSFKGQTETQVMTMFAHARRGEVNYSNNPTFLQYGQTKTFHTSSHVYEESKDIQLKNFVSSSYSHYSASFERQVFISRVALYDKNKNLIGVATLANPVLKKEAEDVSFKLKLDI